MSDTSSDAPPLDLNADCWAGCDSAVGITARRKNEAQRLDQAYSDDPELQQKANAVAYAHHLLFNGQGATFIDTYLDTEFKHAFKEYTSPFYRLVLAWFTMFVLITVLPWVYGHVLMKDPCKVHSVKIQEIAGSTEHIAEVGCGVQSFMRSWKSFLMGPAALTVIVVFQCIGPVALMARLNMRRFAKRMKLFVYAWVHNDLWKLWYQPFNDEGRNLALICTIGLYACIVMEFLVISVLLKDGLALAAGYALSRLLLVCANVLLAPNDMRIEMVNAELRGYEYPECDASLGQMLDRLRLHVSSSAFFVTKSQLDSFYNIPLLNEAVKEEEFLWSGDAQNDGKHGMPRMTVEDFETPIQNIYISDLNLFVPVKSIDSSHESREAEVSLIQDYGRRPIVVDMA